MAMELPEIRTTEAAVLRRLAKRPLWPVNELPPGIDADALRRLLGHVEAQRFYVNFARAPIETGWFCPVTDPPERLRQLREAGGPDETDRSSLELLIARCDGWPAVLADNVTDLPASCRAAEVRVSEAGRTALARLDDQPIPRTRTALGRVTGAAALLGYAWNELHRLLAECGPPRRIHYPHRAEERQRREAAVLQERRAALAGAVDPDDVAAGTDWGDWPEALIEARDAALVFHDRIEAARATLPAVIPTMGREWADAVSIELGRLARLCPTKGPRAMQGGFPDLPERLRLLAFGRQAEVEADPLNVLFDRIRFRIEGDEAAADAVAESGRGSGAMASEEQEPAEFDATKVAVRLRALMSHSGHRVAEGAQRLRERAERNVARHGPEGEGAEAPDDAYFWALWEIACAWRLRSLVAFTEAERWELVALLRAMVDADFTDADAAALGIDWEDLRIDPDPASGKVPRPFRPGAREWDDGHGGRFFPLRTDEVWKRLGDLLALLEAGSKPPRANGGGGPPSNGYFSMTPLLKRLEVPEAGRNSARVALQRAATKDPKWWDLRKHDKDRRPGEKAEWLYCERRAREFLTLRGDIA
jgi:hypothetical protein